MSRGERASGEHINENVTATDLSEAVPQTDVRPSAAGRKIPRRVWEFIIRVTATVVAVWISLTFLFGIYICHSDTCYPMVKDGDLCVTWLSAPPEQGDLIVYSHDGETRFGRVAAVSGDRVDIRDGVVWVNGFAALSETLPDAYGIVREAAFPMTVPDGSVFVLSDNLSDINDSRTLGAIPLADCHGSVVFMMRRRGF